VSTKQTILTISIFLGAIVLLLPLNLSAIAAGANPPTTDFPTGEIVLNSDIALPSLDLAGLFQKIFRIAGLVIGILVLVAFITAGFFYLTAAGTGNEEKAKSMIIFAIVGAIIASASYLIGTTLHHILNFVGDGI
jgi:hypothetical protein